MANNVDESMPHCAFEPCWRYVLGSLPFKQRMPESLTQIQDDTCEIHGFKVNLLHIFLMVCVVGIVL